MEIALNLGFTPPSNIVKEKKELTSKFLSKEEIAQLFSRIKAENLKESDVKLIEEHVHTQ